MPARIDFPRHLARMLLTCLCILACPGRENADTSAVRLDTAPPTSPLETACNEVAERFRALPSGRVEQVTDSFPAFTEPERRYGCVIRAYGPLREPVTVAYLAGAIADSLGPVWKADPMLVADGPNGTVYGLRREDVLCLFRISWNSSELADSAAGQEPQYVAEVGCEPVPLSSN